MPNTTPAPIGTDALRPIITWLDNGCDPKQAAEELRLLVQRADALASAAQPEREPHPPHRDCGCASTPSAQGDASPTMPKDIEMMATNRYRPVPSGMLAYKVVGGDGNRSLFSGTKDECQIVARKLTEAFLDGAHVARSTQPAAPAAQGDALDAARWRMLPAFFYEYQIDALKLFHDIDAAIAARAAKEGGKP